MSIWLKNFGGSGIVDLLLVSLEGLLAPPIFRSVFNAAANVIT
jgi:hypothetical protein